MEAWFKLQCSTCGLVEGKLADLIIVFPIKPHQHSEAKCPKCGSYTRAFHSGTYGIQTDSYFEGQR